MRQTLTYTIFILFLALFVKCSNGNNSSNEILTIDLEQAVASNESVDLKSITTKVEYVALETNDSIIIAYSRAFVTDKYILIVTSGNNSNMYLFDRQGKFIRRIGQIGQGPEDYGRISAISVDKASESVYIQSDGKTNILKYGFNGSFSKFIDIGKSSSFIYHNSIVYSHIPSMYFKETSEDIFQLIAYNNNGKVIKKYHPVDYNRTKYLEMFMETPNFSVSDNKLYYYLSREDIVYELNKDSLLPYLKINLGKYAFSADYKWDYQGYGNSRTQNKIWIEKVFVTKSYILFVLSQKGIKRIVVYDTKKQTAYNILENSIDYMPLNYVKYIYNDKINTVLLPSELIDNENKDKFPIQLKNILKTLNEDSNPVVRIVSLK